MDMADLVREARRCIANLQLLRKVCVNPMELVVLLPADASSHQAAPLLQQCTSDWYHTLKEIASIGLLATSMRVAASSV